MTINSFRNHTQISPCSIQNSSTLFFGAASILLALACQPVTAAGKRIRVLSAVRLLLGPCLALLMVAPAWATTVTVTATAQVDVINDHGWPGQALSDHVMIGDTISATFVLDSNAYNSYLITDHFNPFDYTAEYRTNWQYLIDSATISVSNPSPIVMVTGTDDGGNLTRTRYEVYYNSSPAGALPDEETDYMQLRASSADFEILGTPTGHGGYFAISQEHNSQGMTSCDDENFTCLFQNISGSPGGLPWDSQTLSLSVARYGWASGQLTALSITGTPVPEPNTALLLGVGLAVLATRKRRRGLCA